MNNIHIHALPGAMQVLQGIVGACLFVAGVYLPVLSDCRSPHLLLARALTSNICVNVRLPADSTCTVFSQ